MNKEEVREMTLAEIAEAEIATTLANTRYDEVVMRYRMSERDAYYLGRVVNGARNVTLMGDCASRLMAKMFGNTGSCRGVPRCRLFAPCIPGDYMEYHARILSKAGNRVTMEVRCFKIAGVPEVPAFESSMDVLETPVLALAATMIYELPASN